MSRSPPNDTLTLHWNRNGKGTGNETGTMEYFLNKTEFSEFRESDKSLKHELVSIKDLLCYQCLCGAEVE